MNIEEKSEIEKVISVATYHNADWMMWCRGWGCTIKSNSPDLRADLRACGLHVVELPDCPRWYTAVEFSKG